MNRQQRRQLARENQQKIDQTMKLYDSVTQKLDRMTQEEVSVKAYEKGYRDGVADAAEPVIKRYYAATMMALNDLYGFGQTRCIRALRRIEECLIEHFTDLDLINETEKKLKIEIDMGEGINRAQPMSEG